MSMSVCLSVCLPASISLKPHAQTSSNFMHMLLVAVAQSSSGGVAISYVLSVLWMTSQFPIMDSMAACRFGCSDAAVALCTDQSPIAWYWSYPFLNEGGRKD